jgi:hypothetical protein
MIASSMQMVLGIREQVLRRDVVVLSTHTLWKAPHGDARDDDTSELPRFGIHDSGGSLLLL